MAKITFPTVDSTLNLAPQINNRLSLIANELNDKVLYRRNPSGEPNSMWNDFDMNSRRILNLPRPIAPTEPIRLIDMEDMWKPKAEWFSTNAPWLTFIETDNGVGLVVNTSILGASLEGHLAFDIGYSGLTVQENSLVGNSGTSPGPVHNIDIGRGLVLDGGSNALSLFLSSTTPWLTLTEQPNGEMLLGSSAPGFTVLGNPSTSTGNVTPIELGVGLDITSGLLHALVDADSDILSVTTSGRSLQVKAESNPKTLVGNPYNTFGNISPITLGSGLALEESDHRLVVDVGELVGDLEGSLDFDIGNSGMTSPGQRVVGNPLSATGPVTTLPVGSGIAIDAGGLSLDSSWLVSDVLRTNASWLTFTNSGDVVNLVFSESGLADRIVTNARVEDILADGEGASVYTLAMFLSGNDPETGAVVLDPPLQIIPNMSWLSLTSSMYPGTAIPKIDLTSTAPAYTLLGRSEGTAGAVGTVSLGSGLTMTGGALTADFGEVASSLPLGPGLVYDIDKIRVTSSGFLTEGDDNGFSFQDEGNQVALYIDMDAIGSDLEGKLSFPLANSGMTLSSNQLVGRGSGVGAAQEISLGEHLSLSGTELNVSFDSGYALLGRSSGTAGPSETVNLGSELRFNGDELQFDPGEVWGRLTDAAAESLANRIPAKQAIDQALRADVLGAAGQDFLKTYTISGDVDGTAKVYRIGALRIMQGWFDAVEKGVGSGDFFLFSLDAVDRPVAISGAMTGVVFPIQTLSSPEPMGGGYVLANGAVGCNSLGGPIEDYFNFTCVWVAGV